MGLLMLLPLMAFVKFIGGNNGICAERSDSLHVQKNMSGSLVFWFSGEI